MRTFYHDAETQAAATLYRPGELTRWWTLGRISVPEDQQGKGVGQRLLDRILADADTEGLVISLEPRPDDMELYGRLVAWYERNGFRMLHSGYMKRTPTPKGD